MPRYEHVVNKSATNGYSQDPPQEISNAQSPGMLDKSLSLKDVAFYGVALSSSKQVFSTGFQAVISEVGNTQLENAAGMFDQAITYGGLAIINPYIAIIKGAADVGVYAINTVVRRHKQDLDNEIIRNDRGTRVNYNTGGYYG